MGWTNQCRVFAETELLIILVHICFYNLLSKDFQPSRQEWTRRKWPKLSQIKNVRTTTCDERFQLPPTKLWNRYNRCWSAPNKLAEEANYNYRRYAESVCPGSFGMRCGTSSAMKVLWWSSRFDEEGHGTTTCRLVMVCKQSGVKALVGIITIIRFKYLPTFMPVRNTT
jgi:hypothetical protein